MKGEKWPRIIQRGTKWPLSTSKAKLTRFLLSSKSTTCQIGKIEMLQYLLLCKIILCGIRNKLWKPGKRISTVIYPTDLTSLESTQALVAACYNLQSLHCHQWMNDARAAEKKKSLRGQLETTKIINRLIFRTKLTSLKWD